MPNIDELEKQLQNFLKYIMEVYISSHGQIEILSKPIDNDEVEPTIENVVKNYIGYIGGITHNDDAPYLEKITVEKEYKYNPKYGDDRICECGHSYYRHFDTYEQMENVGCKYCQCYHFKEKSDKPNDMPYHTEPEPTKFLTIDNLIAIDTQLNINGNDKFEPNFYWVKNDVNENAERINRPHINAEGEQENRIDDTVYLLELFSDATEITISDMFNIQNLFIKSNNHKGIKPGIRNHGINFNQYTTEQITNMIGQLFPINFTTKEDLLLWYKVCQKIHPLSDLNGRVFGTIVAILYK